MAGAGVRFTGGSWLSALVARSTSFAADELEGLTALGAGAWGAAAGGPDELVVCGAVEVVSAGLWRPDGTVGALTPVAAAAAAAAA
eukprot:CAMPEP_0202904008 /NCGR_PEP_ID=MMETSP1392-20130828/27474_1 /ASSEMBLY_ACC=CAM_ASM_000868 /TAXON_ID=225041 /ORGANISM="Chlamydomonas chlamydogama, Strain SAG 11-48b" /LENGTH=85 /DNA_ID=CAMNT_0049591437 /DNA_START=53 /DNA_END=308 /DNA_ORIENTATION=-